MERQWRTWDLPCGERRLKLGHRTCIMGILNATPDSFSDGGRYANAEQAVQRGLEMLEQGADIIDVGGESTRPGSSPVAAHEELERVLPVIAGIRQHAPAAFISIDTYKAEVADAAIRAGASMINDVWGFQRDAAMAAVAAAHRLPVVLMHNQIGTRYTELLTDIALYLERSIQIAHAAGLSRELVIIDPGLGFGKTAGQNLDVMRNLALLQRLNCPILFGSSRKSTIGKVLGGLPVEERLEGTAATVAIGIANGAEIVRVHDITYMKRVAVMTDAILRPGRGGFVAD